MKSDVPIEGFEPHRHALARHALDGVGIVASVACAIHCFAGLLLASASGLGLVLADERIELGLFAVAALIASVALGAGVRGHGRWAPALLGLAGLAAITVARLALLEGSVGERASSIGGAALLVTGHAFNVRAYRHLRAVIRARSMPLD